MPEMTEKKRFTIKYDYQKKALSEFRQSGSPQKATNKAGQHVRNKWKDTGPGTSDTNLKRITRQFRTNGDFDKEKLTIFNENGEEMSKEEYLSNYVSSENNKTSNKDSSTINDPEEFVNEWVRETRYDYNEEWDKEYRFYLSGEIMPVEMSEEKYEKFVEDYTAKDRTKKEICDEYNFDEDWLGEIFRIMGVTHSSIPITDQSLSEMDDEEAEERIIQLRKQSLKQKLPERMQKERQKAFEKWNNIEQNFYKPLMERIEDGLPDYTDQSIDLDIDVEQSEYAIVTSLFDLHYGKYGWADQVNDGYSRDEASKRLKEKGKEIFEDSLTKGKPEVIKLIIGGDFFQVDTHDGTTTSGTSVSTDGTPAQIVWEGYDLAIEYIDMIRKIAPVELDLVCGNHDEHSSIGFLRFLDAHYRKNDDVKVNLTNEYRTWTTYGNTFMGICHGRYESRRKLPELFMSHDDAKEDWAKCDEGVIFVGDKHNEKTVQSDVSGWLTYQVPSLSGSDTFEHKNGWQSRAAMSSYVIDKDKGMKNIIYAPVLD